MTTLDPSKSGFSRWQRIVVYSLGWILAFVTTDPTLGFWSLVYMFPLGLFAFISPENRQSGGWTVIAVGWMIYLVHGWFFFRSRKMSSTILLFALLILLLAGNVSGCRAMIHAH